VADPTAGPTWDGTGQRIVVTGASSGIGAEVAVQAAAAGATVALVARRADRLEEVLERCREHGATCDAVVADLSDLDGIEAVAGRCAEALGGPVDVLVNNAGVPKRRAVRDMTLADAEEVMRINYFSHVALTLAVLPGMVERDHGHVVNVSSMGAHMVAFRVGAYSASKAALELFTEALHVELNGTGVRAHLFVPGTTLTEFSTPKPGNDPPFPQDPSTAASADQVATALLGALAGDDFVSFATERDAATAAAKSADPNAFLARMAEVLAGR
jgi:short-subunit dehydrogenase